MFLKTKAKVNHHKLGTYSGKESHKAQSQDFLLSPLGFPEAATLLSSLSFTVASSMGSHAAVILCE